MTPRAQVMVAIAVALAEYLTVSLLFDARELVPEALKGVGELAPIPIVAGVAFLIMRSSAQRDDAVVAPAAISAALVGRRAATLLLAQLLLFGALLALSFTLRARIFAGADALALGLGWSALAALTAGALVAFALAGGLGALARRLAGPLGLAVAVGVAGWAAGQGTGELWAPLARATLAPIASMVGALSDDLVVDVAELVVGTERFSIRIDPECSGYEGMGLAAVLVGSYLWSFRAALRFPHALALPVIAVALAFVANVARITALLYVGALGSADVAVGGFHSKAGWLLWCAVVLGVVAVARRARFLQRPAADVTAQAALTSNLAAPYLVPLLALVASSLVAGLASDGGLDHFEIVAVAATLAVLGAYRRELRAALASGRALVARPTVPALAAGLLVFALWLAVDDAAPGAGARALVQLEAWPRRYVALWLAARLLASVLIIPLVEELAFRGFLLRRLVAAEFTAVAYRQVTPIAVVGSSLVFGVLHEHAVAGTIAGVVYAATAARTGRLRDAVLAHAVTNALVAAAVLAGDRWSLWEVTAR